MKKFLMPIGSNFQLFWFFNTEKRNILISIFSLNFEMLPKVYYLLQNEVSFFKVWILFLYTGFHQFNY
jgi:hypothetical protein